MAKTKKKRWWNTSVAHHQIIKVGDKATLIMMPRTGPFAGFKFWYPNKLIKDGPYAEFLSCCDDMEITMWGKKTGEVTVVTGDELKKFGTFEEPAVAGTKGSV